MSTLEELYRTLLKSAVTGNGVPDLEGADPGELDCLLHPEAHPPVWRTGRCTCGEGEAPCAAACLFEAIVRDEKGELTVDPDRCAGCAACIAACRSGRLTASRDVLPALDALKHAAGPAYALIAPAFLGQFSAEVTPGRLRSAFKALGFSGMVEVALFADVLTLKEALEFDRNVCTEADFQLTSCCCPLWIAMIRKVYHQLMPHVPGAVSPMIAAGRTVKHLHPDALTVFVGPCLAKKAEAREPDLRGAVDYVLTFQEMQDIFDAAGMDPRADGGRQRGGAGHRGAAPPGSEHPGAYPAGRRRARLPGHDGGAPEGGAQRQLLRGYGLRGRLRRGTQGRPGPGDGPKKRGPLRAGGGIPHPAGQPLCAGAAPPPGIRDGGRLFGGERPVSPPVLIRRPSRRRPPPCNPSANTL